MRGSASAPHPSSAHWLTWPAWLPDSCPVSALRWCPGLDPTPSGWACRKMELPLRQQEFLAGQICFQNLEGAAVGQQGSRPGFRPARGGGRCGRLDLPWGWPLLVRSLSATEFPPQSSNFLHDLLHQNSNMQQPCSRLGSRVRLNAPVLSGCSVWDGHMWAAHPGPCLRSLRVPPAQGHRAVTVLPEGTWSCACRGQAGTACLGGFHLLERRK